MATKKIKMVRGQVVRVTRLDACGIPDPGASAVAVTDGIQSITFEELTDAGTDIRVRNFADRLCLRDDANEEFIGYQGTATLCGVDPGFVNILTRQEQVTNAAGDIVGVDVKTGVDLQDTSFALEVWTRLADNVCGDSGYRGWGYNVFPFLKGGRLSAPSFENGPSDLTITGFKTYDGNGWGSGPFDVDRDDAGLPIPLFTPLDPNTHWRMVIVNLDPPLPQDGAFPLASV